MVDFETIKQKIEKSEAINQEIVPDIVALLKQDIVGNRKMVADLLRLCDEKAEKWDRTAIKLFKIKKDSSFSYKKNIRKYIMRQVTKLLKSREFRNCCDWVLLSKLARDEVEFIRMRASREWDNRNIKLMSDDDFQIFTKHLTK